MPTPILRLVTVDVTNTMIRIIGSPGKHYALVAAKHGIEADEQALTSAFLQHYKLYCGRHPNFGASCNMPAYKWWTGLVTDTFIAVGVPHSEVLNTLAKDLYFYYAAGTAWELLPKTREALEDLQNFDVKIGVISNFDHRLYKVLADLDLRKYFDFILPSYVVGVEKPNRLIFQRALEDGKVLAEEAVHFGDSVEKDFIGARNAGMMAYLLETSGINHDFLEDKYVVKSVKEFVTAISPHLPLRSLTSS
ncbi:haloacid dehalogenase-like hydrolase domain-containing protein 3 [Babylonia areolata]|uniref:haloacid dehalogenase-like hydrolase domain-containing protein 3 n=1 Tax=Babylonia areolata TaxID=304850 RepID=UPI003FD4C183